MTTTWADILIRLDRLRSRRRDVTGASSAGHRPLSPAIVTFRVGADGVARMIAHHRRGLRAALDESGGSARRIVLITGHLDTKYWRPEDLADQTVLIPGLGLNCDVSSDFYKRLDPHSDGYRDLPERILAKAETLAEQIRRTVQELQTSHLIIENVNSLPYNICSALATVLVSESLDLPVLNICHDYYWEHRHATRQHLHINADLPEVFGLVEVLCPWRSTLWKQVATTETARQWLVNRGFSNVSVVPYTYYENPGASHQSSTPLKHIEAGLQRWSSDSPGSLADTAGVCVVSPDSSHPSETKSPFRILIPAKLSSGKNIDRAVQMIAVFARSLAVRDHLRLRHLRLAVTCAGPFYDVPDASFIPRIWRAIDGYFHDTTIDQSIRHDTSFAFLLGVPPPESTSSATTIEMLYRASDLVLFSSERETWGLPIIDASIYMSPLVVTRYTGAHTAIFDEVTDGLLCGIVEGAATDQSLIQWLTDDTLRHAAALHNAQFVRRVRHPDRVVASLRDAIRDTSRDQAPESHDSSVHLFENTPAVAELLDTLEQVRDAAGRAVVVALVGPPHWGKSTFVRMLAAALKARTPLNSEHVTLSTDDFGLSTENPRPGSEFGPEHMLVNRLVWTLTEIRMGRPVVVPRFTHGSGARGHELVSTSGVAFLEGIFAGQQSGTGADGGRYADVRALIDVLIWIDADVDAAIGESIQSDLKRGIASTLIARRVGERRRQYAAYVRDVAESADYAMVTGRGREFRKIMQFCRISRS